MENASTTRVFGRERHDAFGLALCAGRRWRGIHRGRVRPVLGVLSTFTLFGIALAGIPEPPVVLHGQITLDGQPVHGSDDVTILARVNGVPLPVGTYKMGDIPAAGDHFVLRLRVESLSGGQPPANDAAPIGQTADLFVRVAQGPETFAGQYVLTAAGVVQQRDVEVETTFGRCAGPGPGIGFDDMAAFVTCLTGVNGDVPPECDCADSDFDGDSDLADWRHFQNAFTGSP